MNVRDIKNKAKSVLANRTNVIAVFVFISVVTTIVSYVSGGLGGSIPFITLIITILMLPFSHGNIVTAMKTVNERGDEVSFESEGVAGLRRFKELFFTYFLMELFLIVIMILIALVMFIIAKFTVDASAFNYLGEMLTSINYSTDVNVYLNDPTITNAIGSLGGVALAGIVLAMIVMVVYNLTFALTPYVLEKYQIRGVKAMSESARLMKGHKKTLFTLYLSYFGWMLLTVLISGVLNMVLPIPLLVDVAMAALMVYIFEAEMNVSVAVFFEEVDLEDKNII